LWHPNFVFEAVNLNWSSLANNQVIADSVLLGTRGLDSATALEFVKTLRLSSNIMGTTTIVAIYQASQNAYDVRAIC
jgi:hypothetical protein